MENKARKQIEDILIKDEFSEDDEKAIFGLVPELLKEVGFDQKNPWHIYDVWNHTKNSLFYSKKDKILRMEILLHDLGKPLTCSEDEKGVRHFPHHAEKSSEMAKGILKRLGYQDDEIYRMCKIISLHSTHIDILKVNKSNINFYKDLLYFQYCDASSYEKEHSKEAFKKLDVIKEKIEALDKNFNDEKNR